MTAIRTMKAVAEADAQAMVCSGLFHSYRLIPGKVEDLVTVIVHYPELELGLPLKNTLERLLEIAKIGKGRVAQADWQRQRFKPRNRAALRRKRHENRGERKREEGDFLTKQPTECES